jgi:hypothetical protein
MEELKNQIMAKLGIDITQAEGAIHTVIEFIKGKVPSTFHGLIDSALHHGGGEAAEGEEAAGGGAEDLLEKAKGMLGGFFK